MAGPDRDTLPGIVCTRPLSGHFGRVIKHITDEQLVRRLRDGIEQRDATAEAWDQWWCQQASAAVYWMTEDLVDPGDRARARWLIEALDGHR